MGCSMALEGRGNGAQYGAGGGHLLGVNGALYGVGGGHLLGGNGAQVWLEGDTC